jgi:hypothetical protein
MIEYIEKQAEHITDRIKQFKASDYFTFNRKDTFKFSFTITCISVGILITGLMLDKLVTMTKNKNTEETK